MNPTTATMGERILTLTELVEQLERLAEGVACEPSMWPDDLLVRARQAAVRVKGLADTIRLARALTGQDRSPYAGPPTEGVGDESDCGSCRTTN